MDLVFFIKTLLAVILGVLLILTVMKLLKWIWKFLIKKPILAIIKFFKPELKDIYNFVNWFFKK